MLSMLGGFGVLARETKLIATLLVKQHESMQSNAGVVYRRSRRDSAMELSCAARSCSMSEASVKRAV